MILDEIVRKKREEVARLGDPDLRNLHPSSRNFSRALQSGRTAVAIVAEIKKASPSAGLLAPVFDPASIAADYVEGGAAAISVLTDVSFFQGSLEDLSVVSRTVLLPILRKDFIVDERQIYEARRAGADAVLLIAAILDAATLKRFLAIARSLGMEGLVEIHEEAEVGKALEAGALLVGINNRDLRTFQVDTGTTLRIAPLIPRNIVVVSESGIEAPEELERLEGIVDAALIGTALMKATDRVGTLRTLVDATSPPTA